MHTWTWLLIAYAAIGLTLGLTALLAVCRVKPDQVNSDLVSYIVILILSPIIWFPVIVVSIFSHFNVAEEYLSVIDFTLMSSGKGYWLMLSNGCNIPFGDAWQVSITNGLKMTPLTPTTLCPSRTLNLVSGQVSCTKNVAHFGDANVNRNPLIGAKSSVTGQGYYIVNASGEVQVFGDAPHYGDTSCNPRDYGLRCLYRNMPFNAIYTRFWKRVGRPDLLGPAAVYRFAAVPAISSASLVPATQPIASNPLLTVAKASQSVLVESVLTTA